MHTFPYFSLQGYRVWWMQDYQFRDPIVIVKCQAYTGAVAATVKDQGVCVWTIEVLYAVRTCFIAFLQAHALIFKQVTLNSYIHKAHVNKLNK